MVQLLNPKTICKVEVVINGRVTQTTLHIPAYPELKDWQVRANERIKYVKKKVAEMKEEISGRDYEVYLCVMSKMK